MTAQLTDDGLVDAITQIRRIERETALKTCAETRDQIWWSGWCFAAVPWFGAGVVFAFVLGRAL